MKTKIVNKTGTAIFGEVKAALAVSTTTGARARWYDGEAWRLGCGEGDERDTGTHLSATLISSRTQALPLLQ